MHDILFSLGFNVRCLIARVVNNQNIDAPRTHRMTLLELNGDNYILDVGFGLMCPTRPLKIDKQDVNKQNYRIIKNDNNNYQLEIYKENNRFVLYTFDLNNYTPADCLIGHFYSSNYPKAVFVNNLVVSLIKEDVKLSLRNRSYHRIYSNNTEIIEVIDYNHLHSIINDDFGIKISVEECKILYIV